MHFWQAEKIFLFVDVPLKDVVESVIETISQVCGNFIDSLVIFINNV